MPLYMTQWSYTAEAAAAMAKNPQDRSVGLKALIEKLGGHMVGCWYSFGEYDGIAIAEMPDQTTELAAVLAAAAPGHLRAVKTTVLISMEGAVEAMKKAGALMYAGPEG